MTCDFGFGGGPLSSQPPRRLPTVAQYASSIAPPTALPKSLKNSATALPASRKASPTAIRSLINPQASKPPASTCSTAHIAAAPRCSTTPQTSPDFHATYASTTCHTPSGISAVAFLPGSVL